MKPTNETWQNWTRQFGKYRYVLLVFLVGLLLLLLPERKRTDPVTESAAETAQAVPAGFSVEREEQRLGRVLSGIRGAGDCSVLLAVDATEKTELARDGENTVVLSGGSGRESTVTVQSEYPTYLGAVVVCTGAGDVRVRYDVLNAVMSYTGLTSDEISICVGNTSNS